MSLLYKNTLKKILKSKGRFISLLLIVMVGVGFYSGIQITAPNISKVASNYYKESNLFDIKIVSTMGFSKENINAIENLKNVAIVTNSYVADATASDQIIRVHAISESMNTFKLKAGTMPKNANEAVGDISKFKLGEMVTLKDFDETLNSDTFKIVGLSESALYIGEDYGPSHKGNGKLTSFIFVNPTAFDQDIVSELYIRISDTSNYDEAIRDLEKEILAITDDQTKFQLLELQNAALEQVKTQQLELDTSKEESQLKLDQALQEIDQNQAKINQGLHEINEQQNKLESTLKQKRLEIQSNQRKLDLERYQITNTLKDLGIETSNLRQTILSLTTQAQQLTDSLINLDPSSPEYVNTQSTITQLKTQIEGLVTMEDGLKQLDKSQLLLNQGLAQLNNEVEVSQGKIDNARYEFQVSQNSITSAKREIEANQDKLNKEIYDAQSKLDQATKDIEALEAPTWHIFNRSTVGSYEELEASVSVISSIAKVFPIFFVLIAMLMTSNSMSRMINEERGELGTLSSLGFTDTKIIGTYVAYSLIISIFGVIGGFLMGIYGIPPLIYTTFSNFKLPNLIYIIDLKVLISSLLVTSTLMVFVSINTAKRELNTPPASLLRPLPPISGKNIFLQNIPTIWNNMSFNWKVTIRNIIRYKKRAIMTLIGVAGCTALLLVGFGIQDSINGVEKVQYGEIFKYQTMITLNENQDIKLTSLQSSLQKYNIDDFASLQQTPFSASNEATSLDTYLITFDNDQSYSEFFGLNSIINNKEVTPQNGAIITEKLADILNVGVGDSITLTSRDFKTYSITISDIVSNMISHFIYINSNYYENIFKESMKVNSVVTKKTFDSTDPIINSMIEDQFAINVMTQQDMVSSIQKTNESLNGIVILIVGVATLLAFVVLYNLTSINISERKRELATLKVLGFYDSEANGYVYREALILTLLSIIIGLIGGIALHRYVISVIEGTGMMFFKNIQPTSYFYAISITLLISIMMQWITYYVILKINMIEALKSNE